MNDVIDVVRHPRQCGVAVALLVPAAVHLSRECRLMDVVLFFDRDFAHAVEGHVAGIDGPIRTPEEPRKTGVLFGGADVDTVGLGGDKLASRGDLQVNWLYPQG